MRTRRSWRNQDRLYRAIGADLARAAAAESPAPAPVEWADTLYDEVIKRGIPHANHESDLYLPCTEEVRLLLAHYGYHKRGKFSAPTMFTNQVEGGLWYDVAFAYAPYWRERTR